MWRHKWCVPACGEDVMFSIPRASAVLLQLQYIANFATSKLQPRSIGKKLFYGNTFCICIFFNLTLRFVFEKYWLVLMLTRAINTTGHPVLSRSHHVRLPPNNLLAPKIILKCDWQIGIPLCGRPILLITLKITDRIGLHSVLLPLLIIWEKPMKSFSVM